MKYRVIKESDEITIITEDGGIACVREAEPIDNSTPRIATSDYYTMRLTEVDPSLFDEDESDVWTQLAEGQMYCDDWSDDAFDSEVVVQAALDWLSRSSEGVIKWELSDDLFTEMFPK